MTNERNDLRTRGVVTWNQTQKGGMSDEKVHHKKEDETMQVETWSQTQKVGMADKKTHCRKEDKKVEVENWSQTQKVGMTDEKTHPKKEAKKAKVETRKQTKKVGMSGKKTHHKKENVKLKVETWSQTQKGGTSDERAQHKKEDEKSKVETQDQMQTASKKEMFDEEKRSKKEAERPMNCGDCSFETHHENELIEHVKTHMGQVRKHTRVAYKGHENTTWMLYDDWEYANGMEEEVVDHAGFFSILGHDKVDDGLRKEMSDQEARHKKGAEEAKEDEKRVEDKEKKIPRLTRGLRTKTCDYILPYLGICQTIYQYITRSNSINQYLTILYQYLTTNIDIQDLVLSLDPYPLSPYTLPSQKM